MDERKGLKRTEKALEPHERDDLQRTSATHRITTTANAKYSHGLLEFAAVNVEGSGKTISGSPNRQGRPSSSLAVTLAGGKGASSLRSSVGVRILRRLSQIKEYATSNTISDL